MNIHWNRYMIRIALVLPGALLVPLTVIAEKPTQEQMDVVRDVIIKMEASCSPGSKCFVEKEKKCLKLETADEKIGCLDDLHED